MDQFWKYSGITLWSFLLLGLVLRLIFGTDWLTKIGIKLFFGNRLDKSLKRLIKELRERKISDGTVADVTAGVIWRLSRIGLIGILISGIPVWLLWQQNTLIRSQNELFLSQNSLFQNQNEKIDTQTLLLSKQTNLFRNQNEKFDKQNLLFENQNLKVTEQTGFLREQTGLFRNQNKKIDLQNERLNLQNNLIEAGRRSSLVFLMSNILDKVGEEIKEQQDSLKITIPGYTMDSLRYKFRLSKPLINRIVGLSRAFRPYRIMQGDTLSSKLVSPERGQLFIALMENNLDSLTQNTIVEIGDFSSAIIGKINLINAKLRRANLSGSYLSESYIKGANLSGANLSGANLSDAYIINADFILTDLNGADLSNAQIFGTELTRVNLSNANLSGAQFVKAELIMGNLNAANLRNARISTSKLGAANFNNADLYNAHFLAANFLRTNGLSVKQLEKTASLFLAEQLDSNLRAELVEKKPCLFREPTTENGFDPCKKSK